MRKLGGLLMVAVLVAGIGYFGFAAVEGSHQLVEQHYRNPECRTPAQLAPAVAYEALNYERGSDAELAAREPNMTSCSSPGAEPGDSLVSSDGIRLAGWYVPAASGVGSRGPTVVLAHGWTDSKSGILEALPVFHDDYNVVLFDFRNHGQSQAAQTTQGIREQGDLAAVLDWLEREKGPDWIVVWGQSMGGHAGVNLAVRDDRVDGLILDSIHSRLSVPAARRVENDGYPLGGLAAFAIMAGTWVRTGVNVWSADPIEAIDDLGDRPVLILNAGRDETIAVDDPAALRDAALAAGVDARLEICPEAGHAGVIEACPDDYRAWVDAFLAEVSPG
jgi:hypothetical protein